MSVLPYQRLRERLVQEEPEEPEEELEQLARQNERCDMCGLFFHSDVEADRDNFVFMCGSCEEEFLERVRQLLRAAMRRRRERNIETKARHLMHRTGMRWGSSPIEEAFMDYLR